MSSQQLPNNNYPPAPGYSSQTKNSAKNSKSLSSFIRTGIAGAMSCSLSHSMLVPFDVLKIKVRYCC